MKLNKIFAKLLAVAAVIGLGASALAQGGFDFYALTKTVPLQVTNTGNGGVLACYTWPIDISGKFIGSAFIDVWAVTNNGTNTVTVTPQTSQDTTNWTSLTNYAISTTNTLTYYTNTAYSGNVTGALLATNMDVYPFTTTTPTASTAGFATQYPLPQPFTNTGYFTPVLNGPGANVTNGMTRIGIANVADLSHYFRLVITNSGTNEVLATFNARRR